MTLETVTPRYVAAIGLLAVVPVLVYGVTNSGVAGLVSAVNVAVIIGSLYLAMSPVEGSHGDHAASENGAAR
ncbi:cytochrome-ba3 oxidase subunit [Haloterrigena salifodinae]|uniref:Cytochrome-ba3 oxidase subunit n=1 Tax=Haloterrigena salifodinae TaxID=2675099 RepID=A0A8T8E5J0_9EURY|nr:cytochrome-ba3 oxidase subunit [Haloterrigena salifodinae]QRV16591.1 cytochrome-ba3 oxidase subunit [Haloterrigena salifodinae]